MDLTEQDKQEVLTEAKKQYKAELVRRIVERAFVDSKERISTYLQGESIKLGEELKRQMPL